MANPRERNTAMFLIGLAMALTAAALMLFTSIETAPLTVIGVLGIVFIGASGRPRARF